MFPAIYPLVILLGLGLAGWLLQRRYQRSDLNREQRSALGIALFVGCMVGARLPFLIDPSQPFSGLWLADGKTILGGILGGYFSVEVAKWLTGVQERTGDYYAAPLAMAVAVGRLGCFLGGCCFGAVSELPWAMVFPLADDPVGVCRHPTQLYEAAFHFAALGLILLAEHKAILKGRRLGIYLASYLVFRFATEFIRPEARILGGLTAYQLASMGLLVALAMVELRYSSFRAPSSDQAPEVR